MINKEQQNSIDYSFPLLIASLVNLLLAFSSTYAKLECAKQQETGKRFAISAKS